MVRAYRRNVGRTLLFAAFEVGFCLGAVPLYLRISEVGMSFANDTHRGKGGEQSRPPYAYLTVMVSTCAPATT
jgi:hypothetical protein